MLFADIIGQQHIKRQLLSLISQNRLSHALLFIGKKGVGKLSLAIAMMQYLCCKFPTNEDSCGSCNSCNKFKKLIHPDVHFTFPIVKNSPSQKSVSNNFLPQWRSFIIKNSYPDLINWYKCIGVENKQGIIYVDESEEIIKKMHIKPYESLFKSFLIWLPEKLHLSAANKLLKVIEEPFENTIIILITEESEKILSTINSRIQKIYIPPIKIGDLEKYFTETNVASKEEMSSVLHQANGSYSKVLHLLEEKVEEPVYFKYFVEMMRIFYKKNITELVKWAENTSSQGREWQKGFLEYSIAMMRGCFMQKYHSKDLLYLSLKEEKFVSKIAAFFNEKSIKIICEEYNIAIKDIANNANPQIVFFDLALKISKLVKVNLQ